MPFHQRGCGGEWHRLLPAYGCRAAGAEVFLRQGNPLRRFAPAVTERVPFFSAFFHDFPLIFRWKAVVDSVRFRVILNITTKRFDVASWHAEMLRFGRRPTAADAASRNAPSREKATLENPQIFQSCKSKNFISAAIARAKRRQFQIVHPTNERSLTYLESTTP